MTTGSNRDAWVIVRAFNEERALDGVLGELCQRGFSLLVVDDGSTDRTAEVARRHPVTLVRHLVNLGPGAALMTGLVAATRAGARIVATFDADGQHAVEDLERIVASIRRNEADVVFGSRFLRAGDRQLIPLSRRALLRGAVLVNGLLTGGWLTDAHNGLRAFSGAAAARIRLHENGFSYASELLSELRRLELRLRELPVTIRYSDYSRAKGQSGWNAVNVLLDYLEHSVLR